MFRPLRAGEFGLGEQKRASNKNIIILSKAIEN